LVFLSLLFLPLFFLLFSIFRYVFHSSFISVQISGF
jgi:hypothetical protein